jgi:nucleotide-binding universal stress UspA family protein
MKILVAIDESESSRNALQQALRLITHQTTTFILLGVEEPMFIPSSQIPGVFGENASIAWQQEAELVQLEEERTQTTIQRAEALCQQADVQFTTRSELGDPKHIICDVARQEHCDLIVVGSHSYGIVDRVLMGSVSDYVVHHAPCAVLVVRE